MFEYSSSLISAELFHRLASIAAERPPIDLAKPHAWISQGSAGLWLNMSIPSPDEPAEADYNSVGKYIQLI